MIYCQRLIIGCSASNFEIDQSGCLGLVLCLFRYFFYLLLTTLLLTRFIEPQINGHPSELLRNAWNNKMRWVLRRNSA